MDIKRIFVPPVFEDEEKNRIARLVTIILWAVIGFLTGLVLYKIIVDGESFTSLSSIANITLILLMVGILVVIRSGYVKTASLLLIVLSWLNLTYQAWFNGGLRDAAFIAFIVIILLANLLLGWQAGLVVAGVSIAAGWAFAYAETAGFLTFNIDPAYEIASEITAIFGIAAIILALTTAGLNKALQRARRSEQSLTESNRELQTLSTSLEQQVEARTRRLEIVAALNERLSAILRLDELLREVVGQVQQNFNYYHAHIYLLDPSQKKLVVAAGTGEAGAQMEAASHSIRLDAPTSLVARAARTGEVVSVDNVREAADWLPNPLLPDTYSEMAVPIVLEGQVVGVLDVQEDIIAGLDEGDAGLLRSLANQVAVAIRNARLFEEVETALAEARAAQERYLEQSWQQVRATSRGGQYHYARPEATSLPEAVIDLAKQTALTRNDPAIVALEQNGSEDAVATSPRPIVAPIKLRDTAIGALQLHPLRADQSWSEDDLAIVEAVIDELAQTAENLRLFEETNERAGREQAIRQITDKLRAAPNLNTLVNVAARELGEQLGVPHLMFELGREPESPPQPGLSEHELENW